MNNEKAAMKKRAVHMGLIFLGLCILAAVMIVLGLNGIGIPCVFYKITGIQCPGCGNTRAVLSLVRGDIKAAFEYNAFFLPEILYLLSIYVACTVRYIKGSGFSYYPKVRVIDIVAMVLFLAWGIIRNLI